MKLVLGCDHAGFNLKLGIGEYLSQLGLELHDVGSTSEESVDYADYAAKAAALIQAGKADRAILVCGTGLGMSIAANRFPRVRAAVVWNAEVARLSREHNDANVLCLPGRFMTLQVARDIARIWLDTPFGGGRHQRRIDKIELMAGFGRGIGILKVDSKTESSESSDGNGRGFYE